MRSIIIRSLIVPAAVGVLAVPALANNVWINEIHYDNSGTDAGEFIEVVIGPGGPAASNVNITLYNGSGGGTYGSVINLADGAIVVGANVGGDQFYVWNLPSNGIQNGSPDGMGLDILGVNNEFLSYEGTFTATAGAANGLLSVDIGVSQNGSELVGSSLGLTGVGGDQTAFTWTAFNDPDNGLGATPGQLNHGQQFPAPGALALLGLTGVIGGTRRRRA
jgi:hypothetical protein